MAQMSALPAIRRDDFITSVQEQKEWGVVRRGSIFDLNQCEFPN